MTETLQRILDLAVRIQQIPAPTFDETARGAFVRKMFVDEGLSDVQTDSVGNVFARLPGSGSDAPLVVSAHLDTVFPADTELASRREGTRIYGPGIGDNSMGVTALFGLLWLLRERGSTLPGDLWLVANTGEEGLGDLRGMRAVVDRFQGHPKAYLVLEGMAYGHIYHKGIRVCRYKINAHTRGGHSWNDYGKASAVHELSRLVAKIAALKLPRSPRTTLNVGRIGGGTSINTIAAEAWIELDMRSEESDALANLVRQVDELVEAAQQEGLWFEVETIGNRPGGELPAGHPLIRLAQSCLREQGLEASLIIGSTDANVPLSRGYPALVLGVTRGGAAHTVHEFIETMPMANGMRQLVRFVEQVWA